MMLRLACLFLVLGVTAAVAAEPVAKRPISHEDVWLMKRLGTPALSPDGRWVVVPVTEPAYDCGSCPRMAARRRGS